MYTVTPTASQVKGGLMKKFLLVLIALSLTAGFAYAIDFDQAVTNAVSVQNVGRTVATDSSAIIKIWSTGGAANPGLGVSSSTSIIVYSNVASQVGYTISTRDTATDTAGEIVDYINTNFSSDSSVKIYAEVGSDARRASSARSLVPADIISAGLNQADSTAIANAQTNGRISVGVEGKTGRINRIKSVSVQLPNGYSATGADGITLSLYDGNTAVWSKYITGAVLRATSDDSNSANTIKFNEEKGISVTKGNSIMAEAVGDTSSAAVTATEKTLTRAAIVYDQLSQ